MNISHQVRSALAITLKRAVEGIRDSDRLREDLGLDSMTSLTFLLALEDHVPGFVVQPESLKPSDLINVNSVVAYVNRVR